MDMGCHPMQHTILLVTNMGMMFVLGMGVVNARGDLRITNDPIDVGPAHEWTGDYTGQPEGYKIWLVPVANIENGKLAWHPNSFLFEKSLAR